MMIVIAALQNLDLDVNTAFLNGDLDKKKLHGTTLRFFHTWTILEAKVCIVVRSLYGLKQTSK